MHRSLPAPGGEAQTSPVSWCRLRGRLFRASSDVYNENGLSRQARAWEGVLLSGVGSEGALVGLRGRKSLGTGTSWPKGQPWAGHRAGERRADGCVGGYVRVPSAVISQRRQLDTSVKSFPSMSSSRARLAVPSLCHSLVPSPSISEPQFPSLELTVSTS